MRRWYPEREICVGVAVFAAAVLLGGAGGVAGWCEYSTVLVGNSGGEVMVTAQHSFDVPPSDQACPEGEP